MLEITPVFAGCPFPCLTPSVNSLGPRYSCASQSSWARRRQLEPPQLHPSWASFGCRGSLEDLSPLGLVAAQPIPGEKPPLWAQAAQGLTLEQERQSSRNRVRGEDE